MNRKQIITEAVNRFLCWKLPEDFHPDGGVSFDRTGHKYEPVGTNLLTGIQAEEMFDHCLPEESTDETAWLIELEGPRWMAIIDGEPQWTDDANKALRFARKEDAENLKAWWCMTATVTEHIWCD